jgi:hypothetical protein
VPVEIRIGGYKNLLNWDANGTNIYKARDFYHQAIARDAVRIVFCIWMIFVCIAMLSSYLACLFSASRVEVLHRSRENRLFESI